MSVDTEGEKGMKDYEKLSREHFDEMADNYAATDGLYYTPLPKLARDEATYRPRRDGLRSDCRNAKKKIAGEFRNLRFSFRIII